MEKTETKAVLSYVHEFHRTTIKPEEREKSFRSRTKKKASSFALAFSCVYGYNVVLEHKKKDRGIPLKEVGFGRYLSGEIYDRRNLRE